MEIEPLPPLDYEARPAKPAFKQSADLNTFDAIVLSVGGVLLAIGALGACYVAAMIGIGSTVAIVMGVSAVMLAGAIGCLAAAALRSAFKTIRRGKIDRRD